MCLNGRIFSRAVSNNSGQIMGFDGDLIEADIEVKQRINQDYLGLLQVNDEWVLA